VKVEKREVRVSKADTRQRAFCDMSDALERAGAEPELIERFAALNAENAASVVQAQSQRKRPCNTKAPHSWG